MGRLFRFGEISPVAVVVPIPADLARPVIGPDHAAVAVRITVIVGRSVEAPEVMPVVEVRPIIRVAIAAMVERARAPVAPEAEWGGGGEPAAVKTTTAKTTAAESATVETSAMKATTSAAEP